MSIRTSQQQFPFYYLNYIIMTIEEVTNNPDILNKEVQSEDSLHFYCPKWDRNFTFVYQKGDEVFSFNAELPKEQIESLDNLKKQFNVFAETIWKLYWL